MNNFCGVIKRIQKPAMKKGLQRACITLSGVYVVNREF
jgi:hypothetical protein